MADHDKQDGIYALTVERQRQFDAGMTPELTDEIRRYWKTGKPFDPLFDGFDRLSVLVLIAEVERLREEQSRG